MSARKTLTLSALTVVFVGLVMAGCISVKRPTLQVPELPVFKPTTASPVAQLGPVQVGGLYCWEEGGDAKRLRGKFAGHNPTDRPIRIRIQGESGLLKPLERFESDATYRGLDGRCVYLLSIVRTDPENAYLVNEYRIELDGHMLTFPPGATSAIVTRFFYDVDRRDIDSIKSYTDPPASSSDVARYVGWRGSNEPLTVDTSGCNSPQFQEDAVKLLTPTSWRCDVVVTYAVLGRAESGKWAMKVVADLQSGRVSLVPGQP